MSGNTAVAIRDIEASFDKFTELWYSKRPSADLLPSRNDFEVTELQPWIGDISIYDVQEGAPFRLFTRLKGTNLVETGFGEGTGQFLDEHIPEQHYDFVFAPYARSFHSRMPERQERREAAADGSLIYATKIVFPLASDGQSPDKFFMLHRSIYPRQGLADATLLIV